MFWERSVDMQQKQVSYLHMFNVFFKIGLFTIGGGLAMIPLIRDEFVERQGWIDDKDITDVLAIAQSLPGVIAVNSATFLGYRLAGIMGALVCTIGVVLPSFLIIFAIAMLFASSGLDNNTYILKFFAGVNAAITVLLVVATKKMFASSVSNKLGWAILLISVAEIYVLGFGIASTVIAAALYAIAAYRLLGRRAE